jgi:hypothetical protein
MLTSKDKNQIIFIPFIKRTILFTILFTVINNVLRFIAQDKIETIFFNFIFPLLFSILYVSVYLYKKIFRDIKFINDTYILKFLLFITGIPLIILQDYINSIMIKQENVTLLYFYIIIQFSVFILFKICLKWTKVKSNQVLY